MKNKKINSRLAVIDLLRGLAIFFVLMNHVNMRLFLAKIPYTTSMPDAVVSFFVWNGQSGVQIFFAISGFLITSSSIQRWGSLENIDLCHFYTLRFARIAPLLLLLLAILSVLDVVQFKDYIISAETGGLARALLAALTFHINLLEAHRGYLPGNWDILWSLSIEEMFYLFFPLLCWSLGRGKLLVTVLLAFVLLGPFSRTFFAYNEIWQEYSYLGGFNAIAMGCLTAMLINGIQFSTNILKTLAAVGMGILILILGFSHETYTRWLENTGLGMTVLAVGTCMLIAATTQLNFKSARILKPLQKLGQLSYEVYLTHMFVVYSMFNLFVILNKPMTLVPLLFVGTILISALLGNVVASYFSEPMNRFIRKLSWKKTRYDLVNEMT
jgi:peptidoglycan/LPS O-acetylase OafA/YrhL